MSYPADTMNGMGMLSGGGHHHQHHHGSVSPFIMDNPHCFLSSAGPPQGVMTSCTSSSGALVVYNGLSSPSPGGGVGGMGALEYVGGVAGGGHPPPDAPDTKEGIEELCPVCGDKVSGYHYGLLTCESCKGFFKRTVQNKKVYTCVADRSCHIDKSQRKRCPYCRFQKCLDVGMKLEAVRADRMRGGRNKFGPMYKRDRARRLQMMRQKQLVRNQCSANGSDPCNPDQMHPGGNPCSPPFGPHSGMASPGIYGPSDSGHAAPSGVKQELIQIPQLSSSTSSPDSSPSPLTAGTQIAASLGFNPAAMGSSSAASSLGASLQTGSVSGHSQGAEAKPCWIPTSPSPGANPPRSPGGPNGTLSPKGYLAHHPLQSGGSHLEGQLPSGASAPSNPGSDSGPAAAASKTNVLLREFQMSIMDEKEWQSQLFGLLQNQSYNQCEVDIFELMCKVIDQSLFGQVDWARNSIFFKDLKVDDQMKLLQHSWSDMLILDHLHQRIHHGLPDETTLANGQKFDLLTLALLGQPNLAENLHHIAAKFQELKLDPVDYICLKFMLLLNPEVRGLSNSKLVAEAHEQAQQTLLEYTLNCYPQINDKFNQLLHVLPEIHLIGMRGEEYLYFRHLSGSAPTQTLLMEMLHAKKK